MKTEASYKTTITMADILTMLRPKLLEDWGLADCPDVKVDIEDIDIEYNEEAGSFNISADVEWENDISDDDSDDQDDDQDSYDYEAEIRRDYRVSNGDLNKATNDHQSKWPQPGKEIVLVARDGTKTKHTVERVDFDGELFVCTDYGQRSVTNFDDDDHDRNYCIPEIQFVRWSNPDQ